MAREVPNRYDDPFWVNLAANTEQKLGLPNGLLVSVLTQGEKTNADRVSSAGARTPFQIIPETRQGAIKKYGIDPYLSPENAAEVAGLLLKDSLSRNAGDVEQAIGEYHGGLDRKQWGKVNESYRQRVLAGMGATTEPQQSTFQRVQQRRAAAQPQAESVAQVYSAYQSGAMTPEDAATFEQAVNSGAIMLPRGAKLKGGRAQVPAAGAAPEPQLAPQALTDAYVNGTMDPRDRAQLEEFMRAGLVKLPPTVTSQIPGEGGYVPPTEQGIITPQPQPTLTDRLMQAGQQIAGAAETALALGTGAVGGTVGTITGTAGQMAREIAGGQFGTRAAADRIEQAAMQAASNLTYAPRTEAGQAQTRAVGRVLQETIPLGAMPGQMAALAQATAAARPSMQAAATIAAGQAQRAGQATAAGVQRAAQAVRQAPARAAEAVGLREPAAAPAAGARQSGGAAATAAELQRYEQARGLPVPMEEKLTVGEITRRPDILEFEKKQILGPEGAPLIAKAEAKNLALMQNMDALFDMTDAQSASAVEAGGKVQKALMEGYQAAKNKVRAAYKNAEKAGELETQVTLQPVLDYINNNIAEADLAPILNAARKKAIAIGAAVDGPDGNLVAQPTTLAKAEGLRQTFQRAGYEGADMFHGRQLRDAFDTATEGLGGDLYAQARALRRQQAVKFENRAVVNRLVSAVKGGDDPRTYAGQVFQRSILNAQPEEITFLKRVLLTSGKDGQQAWKELQGSLVRHIQEQSTKGVGMDSQGRPMVSTAQLHRVVAEMDKNGRLDIVLGKQRAAIVRDLSDVARYISTVPPGTQINNSGTSMALMMAIAEAGGTGALTGLPLPVMSVLKALREQVKSAQLRAKIQRTLTYKPPQ
jgi:hypothetical protein